MMKLARRVALAVVVVATPIPVLAAEALMLADGSGSRRSTPIGSGTALSSAFCAQELMGELFLRTELFFGLSRETGPDVTDEEFRGFVDTKVTPRFPAGLTVIEGFGQFLDSTGQTAREGSRLLVLLYKFNAKNNAAIEAIRQDYIDAFQQQSVLRVDERSCVSF
jgi:Protein of unknown function (DUF3574)